MCIPLLKKEIKSTWKIFLIVLVVLLMYTTIIISMFDPDLENILAQLEEAMPELMAAIGMSGVNNSDLVYYISSYLFGFVMIVFPMIFSVVLSNRLIVKYVDSGAMACLLMTPNKRIKIIINQAVFLIGSLVLLYLIMFVITIGYCGIMFPKQLDLIGLLMLYIGALGLIILISGIGFFVSCFFNELKRAYFVSIGVPVLCYVIQMMANQGDTFEFLKYVTFFSLFSTNKILDGNVMGIVMILIMYGVGSLFYVIGGRIFIKKNLPI